MHSSTSRLVLWLLMLLYPLTSHAQTPDSLFVTANNYYMQRQYPMAEQYYTRIIKLGYESADLYFNLANSLYKQEKMAPAILYYEKALLLKPGDEDIKENLKLANARIIDKIDAIPEFFVKRWINTIRGVFSPDAWALISIVVFVSGLIGVLISYFNIGTAVRKAALATGLALIVLSILTVTLTVTRVKTIQKREQAIIMSPSVTARSSPDEQSTGVFVLHEGTKVVITDSIQSWKEIRIADGNTGWIKGENLGEI